MYLQADLLRQIQKSAQFIPPYWPLRNFIAVNPLAEFETFPFKEAIKKGSALFKGRGLPSRQMGQKALTEGKIKPEILKKVLLKYGNTPLYKEMTSPSFSSSDTNFALSPLHPLDIVIIKYLAAFLDEGQATWSMPAREEGFYACWKALAIYDPSLKDKEIIKALPSTPLEALEELLKDTLPEELENLLIKHFIALPGWTAFIKWRAEQEDYPWQQAFPITLVDYLAVRLACAQILGIPLLANSPLKEEEEEGYYWLEAWEETYRQELLTQLKEGAKTLPLSKPIAQFIFCIDVRSEVFRRHLEKIGPYETFGFAGFFGVPLHYLPFGEKVATNSCPVLLKPQVKTTERPSPFHKKRAQKYLKKHQTFISLKLTFEKLKHDIAASFPTSEAMGAFLGLSMISRTIAPFFTKKFSTHLKNFLTTPPELELAVKKCPETNFGLTYEEGLFYAEKTLKGMGLTENFAPLVMLCGHGSQTINNPYAAALNCGACGGNHGGPNAKLMAAIFNDLEVRLGLKEKGIVIPKDTVFVAAQHNTTTDDVEIFSSSLLLLRELQTLKKDLKKAKHLTVTERQKTFPTKRSPKKRATDWAETCPEWGLARNASFVVGPRALTKGLNLEGRTFLHSYNWQADKEGKHLEVILTAPMIVAQWINMIIIFMVVAQKLPIT